MRGGGKEEDEIEEAAESSPYDGLPTAAVAHQGANTYPCQPREYSMAPNPAAQISRRAPRGESRAGARSRKHGPPCVRHAS